MKSMRSTSIPGSSQSLLSLRMWERLTLSKKGRSQLIRGINLQRPGRQGGRSSGQNISVLHHRFCCRGPRRGPSLRNSQYAGHMAQCPPGRAEDHPRGNPVKPSAPTLTSAGCCSGTRGRGQPSRSSTAEASVYQDGITAWPQKSRRLGSRTNQRRPRTAWRRRRWRRARRR